ncbi:MAG: AraC family transcriptional regulator [Beijerinckiaceae bacterium]|nr:AraC family transcriptional regulator [Beijerinckiaceae bacterium]
MTTRTGFQRAGAAAGTAALLRELGVDPAGLSDLVGFDVSALLPETPISFAKGIEMLDKAARMSGCAHFGLLLGARYGGASHGVIHRLAASAETLKDAMLDHVNCQVAYSGAAAIYFHRLGADYAWGIGTYDRASPGSRQYFELCVAVGVNLVRDLTEGAVRPLEIWFAHTEPSNLQTHRSVLKAPLFFNQHQTCLVFAERDVEARLPGADSEAHSRLLIQVRSILGLNAGDITDCVRRMIRLQLQQRDPSIVGAARALRIHPRTLGRRLAVAGTTFEKIRDDVRYVLARELLALTDLSLVEVSDILAFSSHSAFARAFRTWSGLSPSAWREQERKSHSVA